MRANEIGDRLPIGLVCGPPHAGAREFTSATLRNVAASKTVRPGSTPGAGAEGQVAVGSHPPGEEKPSYA